MRDVGGGSVHHRRVAADEATVDNEAFVRSVSATVAAIAALADAYLAVPARFGYTATVDSPATAEEAAGRRFANDDWVDPASEAHTSSGFVTFAGIDHLRSYAHLFSSPPIPVYSHLVVARAGLEALGWGRWLADEAIGVERRIKRERVYQLGDALQRKRFPAPEMQAHGASMIERVRRGAPPSWVIVCNSRRVVVAGEESPAPKTLIGAVLSAGGPTPDQLGAALWSMLSGTTHATRYALIDAMTFAGKSSSLAPRLAGLATTSTTVELIGAALLRSALSAGGARLRLMGWVDDEWTAAVADAERTIARILAAPTTRSQTSS